MRSEGRQAESRAASHWSLASSLALRRARARWSTFWARAAVSAGGGVGGEAGVVAWDDHWTL